MPATRNVSTRMPIATVSEQQWHQAFRELRRADWPDSLAELQRQSLQYSLVRLRATLIARGIEVNSAGNPVRYRAALSHTTRHHCDSMSAHTAPDASRPPAAAPHRGPDRKCLAAGDRGDD